MFHPSGKLFVGLVICWGLVLLATGAWAKSVTLQWDANTEPNVAGYKVYYKVGTGGAPFDGTGAAEGPSPVTVGNFTTKILTGLIDSQTYTFTVTAYDSAGMESDYSNSVTSLAASVNSAPVIAGTPATSVSFGSAYSFQPTASDPDNNSLTFSIANKPVWAGFNASSGALTGTPTLAQAGTTNSIVISVSDGSLSASLPAFNLTVIGDVAAPTASVSPVTGSYANQVTVTLSASDNTDPAPKLYYTTNGSNPTSASAQYGAPLVITTSTTVKFMARDASGNQSAVQTAAYTITIPDTTAPTASVNPAAGSYANQVTVTLSASDNTDPAPKIYYTTNGSNPTSASAQYSVPLTLISSAIVKFLAVDASGNQSAVQSVAYTITIPDTTAPTASVNPAAGSYANQVSATLSASDNTDLAPKIYYTTNGSNPTSASAQYSAPLVITTSTTVKFMARDASGNQSAVQSVAYTITIPDTTAPTASVNPAAGSYANQVSATLSASDSTDPSPKIYYTLNGNNPTASSAQYSSPLVITSSTTVKFMARDASGNQSAVQTVVYTMTQPPVSNSGLSFVAADTTLPGVTRVDGGPVVSNLDAVSGNPMVDVDYTFRVVYQDTSGTGASNSVYLVLNGYAFPMSKGAGSLTTGVRYSYTTWLGPAAAWSFHYEVRDGSGNSLFRLPQTGEMPGPRVRLLNGGNFLGIAKNLATSATTPVQAFGAEKAYAWVTNRYGRGGYQEATLIDSGTGYYVYNSSAGPLPALPDIPEQEAASVSIALNSGWNIVSNPYGGNVKLSDVLVRQGSRAAVSWAQAISNTWLINSIYYARGSDWASRGTFGSFSGFPDGQIAPWIGYWVYLNATDGPYALILPKPQR